MNVKKIEENKLPILFGEKNRPSETVTNLDDLKVEGQAFESYSPKEGAIYRFPALNDAVIKKQPVQEGGGEPIQDAYGPTMLACLEYIAHHYGIHPHLGSVWFSLGSGDSYEYEAVFYGHRYEIRSSGRQAEIRIDGKAAGRWDCGIRLVTDEDGNILRKVSIESGAETE